jgi:hypothetical protein
MLIYYKKPHKSAQNRWRLKISLYICTRKQASSTTRHRNNRQTFGVFSAKAHAALCKGFGLQIYGFSCQVVRKQAKN